MRRDKYFTCIRLIGKLILKLRKRVLTFLVHITRKDDWGIYQTLNLSEAGIDNI